MEKKIPKNKKNQFGYFSKNSQSLLNDSCVYVCVLGGWVLWHINLCRLFNAKSIFIKIVCSFLNNSV